MQLNKYVFLKKFVDRVLKDLNCLKAIFEETSALRESVLFKT